MPLTRRTLLAAALLPLAAQAQSIIKMLGVFSLLGDSVQSVWPEAVTLPNTAPIRGSESLELTGMGFDTIAPADGAFYAWVDVRHVSDDAEALCATWLAELGVAATPGIDFDPARGHHFVRFSFCGADDEIAEAVRRLGGWMANRR